MKAYKSSIPALLLASMLHACPLYPTTTPVTLLTNSTGLTSFAFSSLTFSSPGSNTTRTLPLVLPPDVFQRHLNVLGCANSNMPVSAADFMMLTKLSRRDGKLSRLMAHGSKARESWSADAAMCASRWAR